ncbi:deoxyribonuclease tatD [Lepidopterella palustris CBS 459.81]|uniref:Deoxyribonuclease tatD n=1 Tax=Lepidopterella palustris CBS 459.81 TaxID=1314670 RepID=A0A8E2E0Z3_9PEZI|nr:deoxyribonuclease tatD [Lepidopterella palustris CBS 459.81]
MSSETTAASMSTTTASQNPADPVLAGLKTQEAHPVSKKLRYADIGINLSDPVFRGNYHGKQSHEDDFTHVLRRALEAGCEKLMVTGSDLKQSTYAVQIAKDHPGLCYATVGVHPCSAKQFDSYRGGPSALLSAIGELAKRSKASGHTVAFGEIGLDYDRLFLTPKDQQLKYFEAQLDLAVEIQLPLFLHSRAASEDFERLVSARLPQLPKKGLVHSFTGSVEEMKRIVEMGLDVGVNGCSMKTEENIEVVRQIPLDRLQIETDGPWCEMRPSHASAKFLKDAPPLPKAVKKERFSPGFMVKGRNESATIPHVAYAIAKIKDISVEEVCEATWNNSIKMFGLGEVSK